MTTDHARATGHAAGRSRSPRRSPTSRAFRRPGPSRRARAAPSRTKDLLIINYSGDLEKVWPTMILPRPAPRWASAARVFVTFWGLQPFVKDQKRITGENWMQKMLSLMQRPGISHRKLSR